MFASIDPSEVNAVLKLAEAFLDFPVLGFPVKVLVELILSAFIVTGIGWRSCKYGYYAGAWAFRKRPRKVAVSESSDEPLIDQGGESSGIEQALDNVLSTSAAYRECCAALMCPEPTFDPAGKLLTCFGLRVTFGYDSDAANVVGVTYDGRQVLPLLSEEEKNLLNDHAKNLKLEVIKRDADRANRSLAFDMRKARLKQEAERQKNRLERQLSAYGNGMEGTEASVEFLGVEEVEVPIGQGHPIPFKTAVNAARHGVPLRQPKMPPVINGKGSK